MKLVRASRAAVGLGGLWDWAPTNCVTEQWEQP